MITSTFNTLGVNAVTLAAVLDPEFGLGPCNCADS
jgi:hypothetical protein